jgi:hypothetical protein
MGMKLTASGYRGIQEFQENNFSGLWSVISRTFIWSGGTHLLRMTCDASIKWQSPIC